jgi:hypothetical protein
MSYTGSLVYLPPKATLKTAAAWLEQLKGAKVKVTGSTLLLDFLGASLRLTLDDGPHVKDEARELSAMAPPAAATALCESTRRIEIVPDDPRIDPDDIYNALLLTFERLREMPNCVGLDPFDGTIYCEKPAEPKPKKRK